MSFFCTTRAKARWSEREGWRITKCVHNINISYDDKIWRKSTFCCCRYESMTVHLTCSYLWAQGDWIKACFVFFQNHRLSKRFGLSIRTKCTFLYNIILYKIMLYYMILYYIILWCYTILFDVIKHYIKIYTIFENLAKIWTKSALCCISKCTT